MGTESLTTALRAHQQQHKGYFYCTPGPTPTPGPRPHPGHRRLFQNVNDNDYYYNEDNNDNEASDSWSLKRLLGRHGKRRYRVLEGREPNRLRKRSA